MYENGLVVAFFLWLYGAVMMIVNANSQIARNLAKVGMRLSWTTQQPIPMSGPRSGALWTSTKYLLLNLFNLVFVLTSWLYVAASVGTMLYQKSKQSGAPQAIRELRWKMRNMELSRDQVITELMKVSETPPDQFEQYKQDLIADAAARGIAI